MSCPINNLLDPPPDFCTGQGAPTSHSGHYGEEAQRRPVQKDAAQRVSYLWDRTLGLRVRSPLTARRADNALRGYPAWEYNAPAREECDGFSGIDVR